MATCSCSVLAAKEAKRPVLRGAVPLPGLVGFGSLVASVVLEGVGRVGGRLPGACSAAWRGDLG